MPHPADGTLRRLVDEPVAVADADRDHVAGCPTCRSTLATVTADAHAFAVALTPAEPVDDRHLNAAWARLQGAVLTAPVAAAPAGTALSGTASVTARARRRRTSLRSPVVAVVGAAVIVTGAAAAAAADWITIFRTESIAPTTLTQADLVALPDLAAYGDLRVLQDVDVHDVDGAAAARQATGLTVPQVAQLPRGVTGQPAWQVGDRVRAQFTFSASKARAAAAAGDATTPPPAGLDGSTFQLSAGPGVAAVWSEARGVPAMIVARAVAPTATSTGVSFETARDYLLSLPGVPADVAAQLRSFSGDGTTLPLPLPAGQVRTSRTDVDGVPATVITSTDGSIAGVVWVRDGIITAVAGTLDDDEVVAVARGLGR